MGAEEGKNAMRGFAAIFGVVVDGLVDLEKGTPVLEVVEKSARKLRKKRSVKRLVDDVRKSKAEARETHETPVIEERRVHLASYLDDDGQVVEVESPRVASRRRR